MKKLLFQIMFLVLVLPAMSLAGVYIHGTVTDTANGNPIPNHAVTIISDSSYGYIYYNSVYTNQIGFYSDTVPVPPGSTGVIFVQTIDCQNFLHQSILNYDPVTLDFTVDFQICNSNAPCMANFSYYQFAARSFQFTDLSQLNGNQVVWIWYFGDGAISTDQNPQHIYNANGWYSVSLAIHNPSVGCSDSITKNVLASDSTGGGCIAAFTYIPDSVNTPPYTYQFIDQSMGNIISWIWTFGDPVSGSGNYSNLQNPTHTFVSPGNYTVCLTVHGADSSCYDMTCNTVIVGNNTGCLANFTYSVPVNTSNPTQFTDLSQANGGGPITSWDWNFGDPPSGSNNTSNVQNPAHLFSAPGYYNVCLTIQGADSSCYDVLCKTVIVGSNTGCQADYTYYPDSTNISMIHFIDQSMGNIINWSWNFGDGSPVVALQNPVHVYPATGSYNVCLTIHGADSSCYDVICKTVLVGSNETIYVSISGTVTNSITSSPMVNHAVTWGLPEDTLIGPHTVYTNSSGFYSDSVLLPPGMTSGTSYVWTQDCESVIEISGGFGPNNYQLHQDFFLNCEINQSCQAKMKVSAAGILTVQFEDQSTGNPTSRIWDFGDGNTSTIENPIHTYSSQQNYQVTLSIANNVTGCSSTQTKTIHFADSLLCNASFSFSNTIYPRTIQFQDLSSGGNGIRHWYFSDDDTSNLVNPLHTFRQPGLYLVLLTIGDIGSSCWQTAAKAVLVTDSVSGCQAMFTYSTNPAGGNAIQFIDQSTGNPGNWMWDFGDSTYSTVQNPLHVYPAPGVYLACLTITANNGTNCTSTFCLNVFVPDSVVYHQIYGQVFAGNFPLQMGLAMIFSLDSNLNYAPYIDVCNIDSNGVYYFTLVPDGNYLVYAIPFDPVGYLPTYYGNVINWQEATLINLGTPNNPYNINLVQASSMVPGPGSASGQINLPGLKSSLMDKINMILMNADGNPISFDRVTSSGTFEFPSLDYGTYYLRAEIAGITSDYVKVVLTVEKPHADVVMTFTGKKILGINNRNPELEACIIYPNPAVDRFNVAINMTEAVTVKVEIFDQMGQMAIKMTKSLGSGQTILTVPVSGLTSGMYTLRITSDKWINITRKLIITK